MTRAKIDMTQVRFLRQQKGFSAAGIARQMGISILEARDAVETVDADLEVKKPRQWEARPARAAAPSQRPPAGSAAPSPAAGSTKESRRGQPT